MNIIDLFSGAGGLTFGFYYRKRGMGFVRNRQNNFLFANEMDPKAAEAFSQNYKDIEMLNIDVKCLSEYKIKKLIGDEHVDLVIGGPPCQSFSTVGQRVFDEKATLYEEYLRVIKIAKPSIFLFENVKGILSMKETFYERDELGNVVYSGKTPIVTGYGDKIIDIITRKFERITKDLGYDISCKTLNTADYGIPENRERVFVVGVRKGQGLSWSYPQSKSYKHLSVKEAISDLPSVTENQKVTHYSKKPQNDFQRLMRNNSDCLTEHYCGEYGDKIKTVIRNVRQGQGKDDFNELVDKGIVDEKYRLTSGYTNTYSRMVETKPSPTITRNMCVPSGIRCIHYSQNRALTLREGARIQTFPDWYVFYGNKDDVASQIGNAVPPMMSIILAKQIEKTLRGKAD